MTLNGNETENVLNLKMIEVHYIPANRRRFSDLKFLTKTFHEALDNDLI